MAEGAGRLDDDYQEYLARFETTLGPCEVGSYAKHNGRVIKKLRPDEFATKWREFQEVDSAYAEIMERGDTINDVLVKVLRERSDELLLERRI
jgi:hypothetical protein